MKELDTAFCSEVGGRKNNEDSFLAKKNGDSYIFIVADGLGGHGDGEIASRAAVDAIERHLLSDADKDVTQAIRFANETVMAKQREADSKMKTTVALALIENNQTIISNVGDTRIYAFKNGKIVFQSIDHSASQLAVFAGEITKEEIRGHVDRNILVRCLGSNENLKVDATLLDSSQYDALLLCSDGFWEYVLEYEMEKTLALSQSAKDWLDAMRLCRTARAPMDCDNFTAVAVIV